MTGETLATLRRVGAELRVVLLRAHDGAASVELAVWSGRGESRQRVAIRHNELRQVAAMLVQAADLVEGGL